VSVLAENTYVDEVRSLAETFYFELCEECGGDLDEHIISPDVLGHAHLYCTRDTGEDN
jgi:hypothetical protein